MCTMPLAFHRFVCAKACGQPFFSMFQRSQERPKTVNSQRLGFQSPARRCACNAYSRRFPVAEPSDPRWLAMRMRSTAPLQTSAGLRGVACRRASQVCGSRIANRSKPPQRIATARQDAGRKSCVRNTRFPREAQRSRDHQPTRRGFSSASPPSVEAITGSGSGSLAGSNAGLLSGSASDALFEAS